MTGAIPRQRSQAGFILRRSEIAFLETGGRLVIITNPENLKQAIGSHTGTHMAP